MFKRADSTVPAKAAEPAARSATSAKQPAGKAAYEARRAAKAGVSLERWMADKQKRAAAEAEAARRSRLKETPRKPGLLRRLLDRAHKPL